MDLCNWKKSSWIEQANLKIQKEVNGLSGWIQDYLKEVNINEL